MADNNQIAADSDATHREINENWCRLHAKAVAEFETATKPDPDPQVEATKYARGFPAAAEILLGKMAARMAFLRDAAQRWARR
jgi:hypothetical protein